MAQQAPQVVSMDSKSSVLVPSSFSVKSSFPSLNIPINPNFAIKFDETNYLIWRQQLKHVIRVYGLQGFIDGSFSAPSRFIKKVTQVSTSDGEQNLETLELNSEFDDWNTRDKIIMPWICSSIS